MRRAERNMRRYVIGPSGSLATAALQEPLHRDVEHRAERQAFGFDGAELVDREPVELGPRVVVAVPVFRERRQWEVVSCATRIACSGYTTCTAGVVPRTCSARSARLEAAAARSEANVGPAEAERLPDQPPSHCTCHGPNRAA